jgi:hypothetical protein
LIIKDLLLLNAGLSTSFSTGVEISGGGPRKVPEKETVANAHSSMPNALYREGVSGT